MKRTWGNFGGRYDYILSQITHLQLVGGSVWLRDVHSTCPKFFVMQIHDGAPQKTTERYRDVYSGRMPSFTIEKGTNPKSQDYFLPDFFFAAQYAFNFADNFARVAVLITVFLAAGLAETVAGFEARTFAHLAF